ncbi:MAG: hypothetical protein KA163_05010 [Bacteroidia bacterium]|nr:hypothetical protein [Bacteroidia bacterium]
MKPQHKKLFKGIALFSVFQLTDYFVGGTDGIDTIKKQCVETLGFIPAELATFIMTLISIPVEILLLYCFVSGLYRICTFNLHITEFES